MTVDLRKINAISEANLMWLCWEFHEPLAARWRNKHMHTLLYSISYEIYLLWGQVIILQVILQLHLMSLHHLRGRTPMYVPSRVHCLMVCLMGFCGEQFQNTVDRENEGPPGSLAVPRYVLLWHQKGTLLNVWIAATGTKLTQYAVGCFSHEH